MTPSSDLTRGSADALVLDGIGRQALVTTRALGRLGLRVTTAESSDLCGPGLDCRPSPLGGRSAKTSSPALRRSRWLRPSLARSRAHASHSCVDSIRGRINLRSQTLAITLRTSKSALALASDAALDVANDKQRTLSAAATLGIAYPRSVEIDRLEDTDAALAEIGYPAVIKPTQSWVSNTDLAARVASKTVIDTSEAISYVHQLNEVGSCIGQLSSSWSVAPRSSECLLRSREGMGELRGAGGSSYDAGSWWRLRRAREHIHACRAGIRRLGAGAGLGPRGLQRSRVPPRCGRPSPLDGNQCPLVRFAGASRSVGYPISCAAVAMGGG